MGPLGVMVCLWGRTTNAIFFGDEARYIAALRYLSCSQRGPGFGSTAQTRQEKMPGRFADEVGSLSSNLEVKLHV